MAAAVGFHFKSQAKPGAEPSSFSGQPPQYINVYVAGANPNVQIDVTVTLGEGSLSGPYRRYGPVELRAEGLTSFHEKVAFTATSTGSVAPGAVIITSSTRPSGTYFIAGSATPFVPVAQLKSAVGSLAQADRFAASFPLSPGQGNTWTGFVFFDSVPIIFQDNGSTFGHLPSVAAYSYLFPDAPMLEGSYDAGTGQLKSVFLAGSPGLAGERTEDFFPADYQASYTEEIQQIVPALSNRQTAYMNPSADSANDADYIWHSNGTDGVEPSFKAIDLSAADSQNQAAFYAGIAFGVAGSAVIALAQEIKPEEWKRKSSTAGAERSASGT